MSTTKRNPETWHLEEQLKVLRKELDAARIAQATRLHVDLEHFGDFETVVRWTMDGSNAALLAAVRLVRHTSFPLDQRDMAKRSAALLNDLCAECDRRGGITEHRITQEQQPTPEMIEAARKFVVEGIANAWVDEQAKQKEQGR